MELLAVTIIVFFILGGGPYLVYAGNGIAKSWSKFLAHREKMAKIKALKEIKQLPASEDDVPPELAEAW